MSIAIIGTVGVPARYGGFETLAENLVRYHSAALPDTSLTVYCSSKGLPSKRPAYLSARLRYIPLNANGVQSIAYDICCLLSSIVRRDRVVLLLGVSGAIALPLVRLMSRARIVTNVDGIEWKREKWGRIARTVLRLSERLAVRNSHVVIADNGGIAEHIAQSYKARAEVIAYGGDHAVVAEEAAIEDLRLPASYAVSVCRIEPENNVAMILEAFSKASSTGIVIVGNWDNSAYGIDLRRRYGGRENIVLLDPIYDARRLKTLRARASIYVHGHSAGGTNPSLVEAMHFGKPVLAFDCIYNRYTTENKALFFRDSAELATLIESVGVNPPVQIGKEMLEIARRRYSWDVVAKQYFDLLLQ